MTDSVIHKADLRILVVGGAGYVGSHLVKCLLESGCEVIVLDDFSTGHRDSLVGGVVVHGDCGDRSALDKIFTGARIDGVMHLASLIHVGESIQDPGKYYTANVGKTLILLNAMRDYQVGALVFSSSAAVYGEPLRTPIAESHPCSPISPYGRSKLMVEMMLKDFGRAYGLRTMALRYFNAAGADPSAKIGERHQPETHLIPLALRAAMGIGPALNVFGADYDTPDGTCIRDYVHVSDIAEAHLLAMDRLLSGNEIPAINLGNGEGFSVRQVLSTVARIVGRSVPHEMMSRRFGDPARLVADASLAIKELKWKPAFPNLESIVEHAYNWEKRHWMVT